MASDRTITTEELLDLQDMLLGAATAQLATEHRTSPLLFVVTARDAMNDETRTILRGAGFGQSPEVGAVDDPNASAIIGFSMSTDPDNLYGQMLLTPGQIGRVAKAAKAFAESRGAPNPVEVTVKQMMAVTGLREKDIQTAFIRGVLELMRAVAYIKLDEVYLSRMLNRDEAVHAMEKGLKDDPRAGEAILVQLETAGWSRSVVVPFVRQTRDSGAVIMIGPPEVLSDTRDGKSEQTGRFSGLLRPTSKMPSA